MKTTHIETTQTISMNLIQTESQDIFFPKGLIGFGDYENFSLHHYGDDTYTILSAQDDPDVRFLLCNLPWDFYPTKDLVQGLIAENLDEIDEEIYAIVCCSKDVPTLNLRAPLVRRDNIMWQVVLSDTYPLDYPLD
jgi:flagellar assembly factor FliW